MHSGGVTAGRRLATHGARQLMTLDLNFGQKVRIVSSHAHNNNNKEAGAQVTTLHSLLPLSWSLFLSSMIFNIAIYSVKAVRPLLLLMICICLCIVCCLCSSWTRTAPPRPPAAARGGGCARAGPGRGRVCSSSGGGAGRARCGGTARRWRPWSSRCGAGEIQCRYSVDTV